MQLGLTQSRAEAFAGISKWWEQDGTVLRLTENKAPDFLVYGTKKGAWPISVETRSKGKKVTVVWNVWGAQLLLKRLKHSLGTGGCISYQGTDMEVIELQGDMEKRVIMDLRKHAVSLKGIRQDQLEEVKNAKKPKRDSTASKTTPRASTLGLGKGGVKDVKQIDNTALKIPRQGKTSEPKEKHAGKIHPPKSSYDEDFPALGK